MCKGACFLDVRTLCGCTGCFVVQVVDEHATEGHFSPEWREGVGGSRAPHIIPTLNLHAETSSWHSTVNHCHHFFTSMSNLNLLLGAAVSL